jgi:hypothetical protein
LFRVTSIFLVSSITYDNNTTTTTMKFEGLEIVEEDGHSLSHHHQLSDHGGTPVKPATTPRNAAMEREAAVARRVSLSRLLVVLVILVSTAAVSVSAFQLLKRDEREDFESKVWKIDSCLLLLVWCLLLPGSTTTA